MKNKYLFAIIYAIFLTALSLYILLDTFIIERKYIEVENINNSYVTNKNILVQTDSKYQDNYITIELTEYREYETNIYVADIKLTDATLLKTAFANNTYGKNVVAKTSTIASENNAILAINGDYYGVRESGYVLKSGIIYRNTITQSQTDLVIYKDGNFEIVSEEKDNLSELLNNGAYNILSFGPELLINNEIQVSKNDEVGKSMASNPRTAIGIIDNLHYIFVVSDGRTDESNGLSLFELATFMKKLNVDIGYNLDGGGSSTMYFNGKIVNNPTTNGKTIKERSVSDIVYIGY